MRKKHVLQVESQRTIDKK